MKSNEFTPEATQFGEFPDDKVDHQFIDAEIDGAVKITDISETLSLWEKDKYLILKKDQALLVGFVKISRDRLLGNIYSHIDLIYIVPNFRKTSAIKWLLYAVKEFAKDPIIADGAIFAGGQDLINSLGKYGMATPSVLNKITGEKTKLVEPINDPDLCYIFESTKLGPGKNYFSEDVNNRGQGWVWYAETLFEEI